MIVCLYVRMGVSTHTVDGAIVLTVCVLSQTPQHLGPFSGMARGLDGQECVKLADACSMATHRQSVSCK